MVIWPSVWPLDQRSAMAAATASPGRRQNHSGERSQRGSPWRRRSGVTPSFSPLTAADHGTGSARPARVPSPAMAGARLDRGKEHRLGLGKPSPLPPRPGRQPSGGRCPLQTRTSRRRLLHFGAGGSPTPPTTRKLPRKPRACSIARFGRRCGIQWSSYAADRSSQGSSESSRDTGTCRSVTPRRTCRTVLRLQPARRTMRP